MMTPDKDYGQLVGGNVFMYRPKHTGGFEVMGIEEVKAKFDIQSPAQVIDMLGLMGDSSDNIPGCPGVGEKTAQKLIAQYGSIENLLSHSAELKGALKTKVETNRKMIEFSKFLATIKIDVPIALNMDELKREEPNEEELRKIFEEMEFRTLIDRVSTETRNPPSPEHTPMRPETTRKDETVHREEAPGREIRRTVRDNSPFSANQLRTVNHPLPRLLLKAISLQNLPTEGRKVRNIRI